MGICANLRERDAGKEAKGRYAITLQDCDGVRHSVWIDDLNIVSKFRVPVITGGGFGAVDFLKTDERDQMGFLIFRQRD